MGTRDKRVDVYIAKSADFAKPILQHFRETVHQAVPEVTETMKWSFPHFDYKGILCSMAAFKEHCAFGFWKGSLVMEAPVEKTAMGHLGRITSVKDLPPKKELVRLIRKAAQLNEEGVRREVTKPKAPKPPLEAPAELVAALKKNKVAAKVFEAFPPSHRREYIEWIVEAKTEATRLKRLTQAIEWIAEGKSRNWKYERK